eukprot:8184677-Pyramimonas_sp.AAC.1
MVDLTSGVPVALRSLMEDGRQRAQIRRVARWTLVQAQREYFELGGPTGEGLGAPHEFAPGGRREALSDSTGRAMRVGAFPGVVVGFFAAGPRNRDGPRN